MDQSSKIVLLFDYFSMESRNLYESFRKVRFPFTSVFVSGIEVIFACAVFLQSCDTDGIPVIKELLHGIFKWRCGG